MTIGRVLTVTIATFSAPLAAPAAHAADLGEPIVAVDHLTENLTNSTNETTTNLAETPLPIPRVGPVHVEPPADSITNPLAETLDHPAPFINPAGDVVTLDDQRALDAELEAVFTSTFEGTLEPAINTVHEVSGGLPANTMPVLCGTSGLC